MKVIKINHGFSLIELLITLAIVTISIAIAYPSYEQYVHRTHRAEAKAALLEGAQFMERRFTERNYYRCTDGSRCTVDLDSRAIFLRDISDGSDMYYEIALDDTATDEDQFLLAATPLGSMQTDECGTFSIDQLGVKKAGDGSAQAFADCWNK